MSVANTTLYIKGEQNREVATANVTLGDLISMECTEQTIVSKLKTIKVLKISESGPCRYVISILRIIECIHREYPNLEVQNLGAQDLIVTYEGVTQNRKLLRAVKIVLVTAISFVGAAFAIMTFNNDGGVTDLFAKMYELFLGSDQEGVGVLEVTYSVGITIGILVFFNHFGKRRFSVDPTPIEVEMRLYENDIQTTLIEDYGRKGQEMDVGKANHSGYHRS